MRKTNARAADRDREVIEAEAAVETVVDEDIPVQGVVTITDDKGLIIYSGLHLFENISVHEFQILETR